METEPPKRRFIDGVKERRERHRERNKVIRAAVALVGFVIVLAGLIMIPLPGPGLLVVAAGLAVLALEFVWAERLLERTIDQMSDATERVKRASRAQQVGLMFLGVLAAAAAFTGAFVLDIPLLPF